MFEGIKTAGTAKSALHLIRNPEHTVLDRTAAANPARTVVSLNNAPATLNRFKNDNANGWIGSESLLDSGKIAKRHPQRIFASG